MRRSIDYKANCTDAFKAGHALAWSILLSIAPAAVAGDAWLQPRRTAVLPGTIAQIDLAIGTKFSLRDDLVKQDRVGVARARLNGKTFDLAEPSVDKKSLEYRAPLSEPGIATLWLSLAPRSLELRAKQVKSHLDEISAPVSVRQAWESSKGRRPWREVHTRHVKTFVRVGRPKDDRSWSQPVGLALEVVPEKDPTALRAGDDFPVRVLKNGSPIADFPLGIVHEGNTGRAVKQTDAAGRAVFKLTRSGHWLLRGTELRSSTKTSIAWESDSTALTFEVR
ncbi:MAG: DUF4198 domain-containing protein [Burkholderiaceae bacterium]|nr:DUF4198 domain-containing protein [Burkholderiaceae bacterium]